MPLEATVLCLDSSSFMRNGDLSPTRFEAQRDAVNVIANAKTQQNPESTVALMKSAGRAEVLATLTTDVGSLLSAMHDVPLDGAVALGKALAVAALCLKHRQNKNQKQRVVAFVGSPLSENERELVKLGKKLKKNNVAVDIVSFGDESAANAPLLEAFIGAVNSSDNSHLLSVPPGPHYLSDMVLSSPIVLGDAADGASSAAGAAAGAADQFAEYGGVDPSMDPELAMALRLSLEEERARAQADAGSQPAAAAAEPAAVDEDADADDADDAELAAALAMSTQADATASTADAEADDDDELAAALAMSVAPDGMAEDEDDDDDDDELAAALAMSVAQTSGADEAEADEDEEEDDDDALQAALAMSLAPPGEAEAEGAADVAEDDDDDEDDAELQAALAMSVAKAEGEEPAQVDPASDAAFLESVLATLPGVDPNDPQIQAILEQYKNNQGK